MRVPTCPMSRMAVGSLPATRGVQRSAARADLDHRSPLRLPYRTAAARTRWTDGLTDIATPGQTVSATPNGRLAKSTTKSLPKLHYFVGHEGPDRAQGLDQEH